jgi:PAS domain-containing protein
MSKTRQLIKPDYSKYDVEKERHALRDFLKAKGFTIPEQFIEQMKVGDVIDLYESPPSFQQLYCNNTFRDLCWYSEEQLKSVPFTQLFWRSDEIQQAILEKATQVAHFSDEAEAWTVEDHELIESFHPNKRTFQIKLGWVAPCFRVSDGARIGFVSSLTLEFMFEWPDAQDDAA